MTRQVFVVMAVNLTIHHHASLQAKSMAPLLATNLSKPQFIINPASVLPSESATLTDRV